MTTPRHKPFTARLASGYRALPRSAKWLLWTGCLLAAYFLGIEPALDTTNALNTKAKLIEAGLKQERALLSPDSQAGRILAEGRSTFGEPLLPTDRAARPEALHNLVDSLLKTNNVTKVVKTERRIPIRGDELTALVGGSNQTLDRLVIDLTFEAPPETVTAILRGLEGAKEVAAISRVELRRLDAGTRGTSASSSGPKILKATISPEAWVDSGTSASSPAGGNP